MNYSFLGDLLESYGVRQTPQKPRASLAAKCSMWEKTHVQTFRGLFISREISRSEGEFFSVNELRTASLLGKNITFVCKRLFSWKLEYIFGEIYCLHQVISLGKEMATGSSCIKLQYVEENGRPNFRGLFTTRLIKSHVKLHVKSDAQTEVLGTQ